MTMATTKNNNFRDNSITIYEALQNIQSGKYVMPAFQRQYVWGMAQIEKLWDSIMIGYPIANFLFWLLDEQSVQPDSYFCNFLSSVVFRSNRKPRETNYGLSTIDLAQTNIAVLDGQQRLTSLFLSLLGDVKVRHKYARTDDEAAWSSLFVELDESNANLDEDEDDYNSKKYDFSFIDKETHISQTKFEISKLIDDKFRNPETRTQAIGETLHNLPVSNREYAEDILTTLCEKIFDEKLIHYTELSKVNQDDALEIFVRFNSAGKPLTKTEITMSILEAYWPKARAEFGKILKGSYRDFSTDFIVRSALMIYGEANKSIDRQVAEKLRNYWPKFKEALKNTKELLADMKIDVRHFKSSWNILVPVLYTVYYDADYREAASAIKSYLVRTTIFDYFQNGTTAKLVQLRKRLYNFNNKMSIEMLEQIPDLRVTDAKIEKVLDAEKDSRAAHGVLYYSSLDWLKENVAYDQDHLHPRSRFSGPSLLGVDPADWMEWGRMCNRLPNLWYLKASTNRRDKNCDSLLEYNNALDEAKQKELRERALIPENVSLELKDFDKFYAERKKLLKQKILELVGASK